MISMSTLRALGLMLVAPAIAHGQSLSNNQLDQVGGSPNGSAAVTLPVATILQQPGQTPSVFPTEPVRPAFSPAVPAAGPESRVIEDASVDIGLPPPVEPALPTEIPNLRAISVPEPGALALTGLALAWAIGSLRKARAPRPE